MFVIAKPILGQLIACERNVIKLTIVVHEMLVSAVPNLLGNWAAVVKIHTHALLLRTLTSEDVSGLGLLDLSLTDQDLVLRLRLDGLNLDDLATGDHADVLQLDLEHIVRQHHANQRSVEAADAANVVLSRPGLD